MLWWFCNKNKTNKVENTQSTEQKISALLAKIETEKVKTTLKATVKELVKDLPQINNLLKQKRSSIYNNFKNHQKS